MAMDIGVYVDAQCALLGITLTPEQRPGVVRYLQLAAALAPRVMDFAAATLTPADESGSAFVPVAVEPGPSLPPATEPPARSER
jgi:hypothetical protein